VIARALRHRNYRLFFAGQGVSLIGTWLTRFAMALYTYELTGSAWMLGLVAFCSQAPTALIAPVAGVLVDRWDRHRTLLATQVLAMLQSAALAAFALTGQMTVVWLMILGAWQAVINAFDMPARQSFVRQMVDDRADLPNAIALNSALVNLARLIGPVIAAFLWRAVGPGWCFGLDAASYLAVIASLLAMHVAKREIRPSGKHVLHELRDGIHYVVHFKEVRALLMLLAGISVCGGAYVSLLPALGEGALHGGPHAVGYLMAASGGGAMVGVLYVASRDSIAGLPRFAGKCGLALGVALGALELAPNVIAALPMMVVLGAGLIALWTATNTCVQSLVDDDKLGRVMSIYAMVFFTGAPVGAVLEGALAAQIGAVHAFFVAGLGCVVTATWFLAR
jgi:MFS family permease